MKVYIQSPYRRKGTYLTYPAILVLFLSEAGETLVVGAWTLSTPTYESIHPETLPSKRRLPHLPTGFGRDLQVNGVDVGFYPFLPLLPHIKNISGESGRGPALQKTPTPSTHRF